MSGFGNFGDSRSCNDYIFEHKLDNSEAFYECAFTTKHAFPLKSMRHIVLQIAIGFKKTSGKYFSQFAILLSLLIVLR